MYLCDIYPIFDNLPDFVPLIQLLVGSVFIAGYIVKPEGSFSAVKNEIKQIFASLVGDPVIEGYKIDEKVVDRLNTDYSIIRRSVMLIMAFYGAFLLFYCATFCQNSPNQTILTQSPFSVLLINVLVTVFLLYSLLFWGKKQPRNTISIIVIMMMILIFVSFVIWTDFNPFPKEQILDFHVFSNVWSFAIMGFSLSIFLKKRLLPRILTASLYRLQQNLEIVSQFKVDDKLQCISNGLINRNRHNYMHLFFKALIVLCNDKFYFEKKSPTSDEVTFNPECTKNACRIIEESKFNKFEKFILVFFVKKHPRARNEDVPQIDLNYIMNERSKVFKRDSKRLISLGIIIKK